MSEGTESGGWRAPLTLAGAVPGTTADGLAAAARYGDREAEDEALRRACGLVDRLWVEHLELGGEDRARFLNGMVTADVKRLAPGGGLFAFFTNAQGRALAEVRVEAHSDRLLLELPAGCAGPISEHLQRYVVADRVELALRPGLRALALVGPRAEAVAARLGLPLPAPERWSHAVADWRGSELILAREARLGGPAICLRVHETAAHDLARELLDAAAGEAAAPAGFEAAEALRVEAGCSRFGPDFGAERFPQEVGAEEALDFEKGCYLGQEVIARIHYRGRVNHRLCGLRLAGESLPAPASLVAVDGDEVGRSGTAASSLALGAIALAVLHRRAALGARVEVGGAEAEVVDLPFITG